MSGNGSRPRVGIVWPEPVNQTYSDEFERLTPGAALHMQAVEPPPELSTGITLEHVLDIAADPNIEAAARKLGALGVRSVAYGCTSGSYARGTGGDIDIADRMQAASGAPSTTTSTATVRALRQLGVQRVAVLSPHVDALNERLRGFLTDSGFDVVRMTGLNKLGGIEEIPPESVATIVEEQADAADAEGVFISCTGLRTSSIVDDLERRLGKPVVGANQATMWDLLRLAQAFEPRPGLGRLYAAPLSVGSAVPA